MKNRIVRPRKCSCEYKELMPTIKAMDAHSLINQKYGEATNGECDCDKGNGRTEWKSAWTNLINRVGNNKSA